MMHHIGRIIFGLREEAGISQKDLTRGILSAAEMSRIETGEKEPDKFVTEALFQRLGKSLDKFETAVADEEYRLIFMRSLIGNMIIEKRMELLKEPLEEYEKATKGKNRLHKQYLWMIRAVCGYLENGEECLEQIKQALELTFSDWREGSWKKVYFCTQEVHLLLVLAYRLMNTGEARLALAILEKLEENIEQHFTDDEEKVRIFPACTWLLSKLYLRLEDEKSARKVCEKGIEYLTRNGSLALLPELLAIQQQLLEKCAENNPERTEKLEQLKAQQEAITFSYEFTSYHKPWHEILLLLQRNQQSELIISNELLRGMRIAKGISQEKLGGDICTQTTLSHIEYGRTARKGRMQELLEQLGVNRGRYYSFVVADDYDTYERVRDFKYNWIHKNQDTAKKILDEIESRLDLDIPVNKQFIENKRLTEKLQKENLDLQQVYEELCRILRYTMPEFDGTVYRIPFREESVILNKIALNLKKQGRWREAADLYEKIFQKYSDSKVLEEHHILSLYLLYLNYTSLMEENNQLAEAENAGRKGTELAVQCQRGDLIGLLLGNLACVYRRKESAEAMKLCEQCLKSSYYLLKIFGYKKDSDIVQQFYQKVYGRNI